MKAIDDLRHRLATLSGKTLPQKPVFDGFARAAVLVPLVANVDRLDLLFTRRSESVETHKGQISFPGGTREEADSSMVETALREAEEEIGLPRSSVSVLGSLDDLTTPTGFVITPVIGFIRNLPSLTPNPDEVAAVFRVPLAFFADDANGRKELREFRGNVHEVWFYGVDGHMVWGVTAGIVRLLLKQLGPDHPASA